MVLSKFVQYEGFILIGLFMVIGTMIKLLGFVNFSSDWFWFIAGFGLIVEGAISLKKQRNFDRKFKIVTKEEYELLKSKGD